MSDPTPVGSPALPDVDDADLWGDFDDAATSTLFGPELVGIELRKPSDPMQEAARIQFLCEMGNICHNKDATPLVCAFGITIDAMMHLVGHRIIKDNASSMQDIQKITKMSLATLRVKWCAIVRAMVCGAKHTSLLSLAGVQRVAGVKRILEEHLRTTQKAHAFAVRVADDDMEQCIVAHQSVLQAWETRTWLPADLADEVEGATRKLADMVEKGASVMDLRATIARLKPVFSRVHAAACQQSLPSSPDWLASRIFCGPGTASADMPKSPQKLGGMRQHRKRKHSETTDQPFDGQEFASQIALFTDARFFDVRYRGQKDILRHQVMKRLSKMAAELTNIYANGHTLKHHRREVTNHLSAPRPGALFEFVIPHLSTTRQEHHTHGDGMFEGFDASKRLSEVTKHYLDLLKNGGRSKIEVLRGFSPTKCEKKGGSLATFVNHITSALICVGVDCYSEACHDVKAFGPYNMLVVVVDLVRASYGSSKSHNQFPGLGLACVRHRKVHVVPCDGGMRAILRSIMDTAEKENGEMRSPEELLDHALVHSELITSGGLLCSLSHLMAGVRSTLSSMANDDDIGMQVESHVADTADSCGMLLSMDDEAVRSCLRHFAETHGSSATTCARHTALKIVMQMMMTHEELDEMSASDVAALVPSQCMFDAGMIPTSVQYFDKLTKNLQRPAF